VRHLQTPRWAGGAAVVLLLLAGCSDSGGSDAEAPATTEEPMVRDVPVAFGGAASMTLTRSQRAVDLGVSFQSGAFLVTVGTVVHDRDDETLYVGMRFQNLGPSWTVPQPEAKLVLDGTEHHVFPSGVPRVPPLHSTTLTGTVVVRGTDPLGSGVLRFGRADESQTTVDLASGRADGFGPPVPVAIDEWGHIGKHTVHLTGGELMADAVRAPRAPTGRRVLRLSLDEYSSTASPVNGFHPADHLVLRWPDGTVVEPLGGSRGRGTLSWTAATGGWVDFAVPADPAGRYEALLASVGVHSFSNLHPELVERVAIPVEVPDGLISGPLTLDPEMVPLPVPQLPGATGPTPRPLDAPLALPEVNVPGFAYTATHVAWDPDTGTVRVDGTARLIPSIVAASTGGLFDTPSNFAPIVSLDVDGSLHNGLLSGGLARVEPGRSVEAVFEFPSVDRFDVERAALLLGQDHMAASMLPLGPESRLVLWPAVPELAPVEAPVVTAGNYQVQLVGWRLGLPRELDRPPPGQLALELVVEVTAVPVEEAGAFGLGFSTRTQLFLTGSDGYLQQSDNHDNAFLEEGETVQLGGTYYVSDRWRPGPITLTIRSVDEITAITRLDWVETTFVAQLLAPEEES
jgi:hypothetical protein